MQTHATTVQECLEPYERRFSDIILGLDKPILMGETQLRRKHNVAARSIKKINDLPLDEKKKLVQLIMNCLPKGNSIQEFETSIINFSNAEKKLSNKPEFKQLETEFNRLSAAEKVSLLKLSINGCIGFLHSIHAAIEEILFLTPETEQALIAKQTVNEYIVLGNLLLKSDPIHLSGKDKLVLDKRYQTSFEALIITIIQLEGVRIGKIKSEVLYNNLAFISQFTTSRTVTEINHDVYAVMGTA